MIRAIRRPTILGRAAAPVALAALVAGCTMPPDGTNEQDIAAYDSALASIGCNLRTEGDYQAMELQTGLTRQQLADMSAYKVETDAVRRLEGGGFRLVVGPCAPAAPAPADAAPAEAEADSAA
ncbi:lipoprotein [Roseivivax marinus]|uniref:Lipoprotein n=1 Tax=Roseivivax marinus TaxID=1379903 RepID=W4HGF2_9RHOB|nr:hypothetical protein [Roseivivax marinus]ETW11779.1 lipoprotein [Roseivivax marinus]SEL48271.1 hypothetical protein SAMN05444413_109175 [Roseivivax marinus]